MRRVFAGALAAQIALCAVALTMAATGCCGGSAGIAFAGLAGYLGLAALARWRPDSMVLGLGVYGAAGIHAALAVVMARAGFCAVCTAACAGAAILTAGFIASYRRAARRAAWSIPIFVLPAISLAAPRDRDAAALPPDDARVVGRADAPVEVEIFVSPSCGACRRFDREILPALLARARVLRRYWIEPIDIHGREEAIRELRRILPQAPRAVLEEILDRDRARGRAVGVRDLPTVLVRRDGAESRHVGVPSSVDCLLGGSP